MNEQEEVQEIADEVRASMALLKNVVKSVKFMPGWMIYIGGDNEGYGWDTLHIVSYTPNSRKPEEMIRVNHSFLIPPATYNERTWRRWIRDCYAKVWDHEIGEFLLFDDDRSFAPHHGDGEDPYTVWSVGDLADTDVPAGTDKYDHMIRRFANQRRLETYANVRRASVLDGRTDEFQKGLEYAVEMMQEKRD